MRLTSVSLALLLLLSCSSTEEIVATKHINGNPEVVVYMQGKGQDAEKVMEKVYYENGQLEYVGRYQNGLEHGEWIYYYQDGTLKFKEQWKNGLEDGIHYDYAPDGQVYREIHYIQGRKVKEIDHSKD